MDGSGFREGARPVGRLALPWASSHSLDREKLAPSWHPGTVGSPWGELRARGGLQQTSRGARSPLPSCWRVPCGSVSGHASLCAASPLPSLHTPCSAAPSLPSPGARAPAAAPAAAFTQPLPCASAGRAGCGRADTRWLPARRLAPRVLLVGSFAQTSGWQQNAESSLIAPRIAMRRCLPGSLLAAGSEPVSPLREWEGRRRQGLCCWLPP